MYNYNQYDFSQLINDLRYFSVLFSFIMAAILGYLFYKLRGIIREDIQMIEGEMTAPAEPISPYDARWQEVKKHLHSTNQAEWKFAVVEADKLADDVLKAAGLPGESMGDRLMSIEPGQMKHLDGLWRAHKIRNLLVHDANFELRRATALEAIQGFE